MASGSITTLGIGSGLDLQDILDQLKEVEMVPITRKQNKQDTLQRQIDAYNSINAKLYSMKSGSLDLSLQSNYLTTPSSLTEGDVLSAGVTDGMREASYDITVNRRATYSSWQTGGFASKSDAVYAAPDSAISDPNTSAISSSQPMTIQYGSEDEYEEISLTLTAGMSLNAMVEAINTDASNKDADGDRMVFASTAKNDDGTYYIRLQASNGGDREDSQINYSGLDFVKADATIAIGLAGSDTTAYYSVAPGTSYEDLVDQINSDPDNPGVTASIIDDGSTSDPYRLTLTANSTGESNRISIQNLTMTEVTGADGASLNASVSVNGIAYQRQSNSGITDIIAGVTLNLKQEDASTTLTIRNELSSVKDSIVALVETFNELHAEILGSDSTDTTDTDEEEDTEGPLANSYTAKSIVFRLQSLLTSSVGTGGSYTSLADIGLSVNRDGSLTLDEEALDEAMEEDPDSVQALFLGNSDKGVTGLGDIINDGVSSMVSSQGIVRTEIDAAETQMDNLQDDIDAALERLDKRYEIMASEFAQLDTYISKLNSQASYLQSIIESFNKTTGD